ncbi:MAG: hypothetical protein ABJ333_15545 [Algoriphagus sp.]|uniref:hypothetical protein n=1 Tax=Algoriphagus sp. TaxID=1872435 RepID=UPI00328BA173
MNTNLKKIVKTAAVGIFFMALFLNVKLSLTDPFINIDNAAIAQTTSSSSSVPIDCESQCRRDPEGTCKFSKVEGGWMILVTCLEGSKIYR